MQDPNGFWGAAAQLVKWDKKPTIILDDSNIPLYRWFSDGMLNTCYNALDRHVIDGRADQPAVIHESAITGKSLTWQIAGAVFFIIGALLFYKNIKKQKDEQ